MNPIAFVLRRPVKTLMLAAALAGGGVFGSSKLRGVNFPPFNNPKFYAYLDDFTTRAETMKGYIVDRYEKYFQEHDEQVHLEEQKIVATSPMKRDVTITEPYVCQIHSQSHIKVCALDGGYLKAIAVKEGQTVKQGDLMFMILPILYQRKLEVENAEVKFTELEYTYTQKLSADNAVSANELPLKEAQMKKAQAKRDLAKAEFDFTAVKTPFDGIVDRQHEQLGSLIKEGDLLTTLSDNRTMWVYFNVTEARYLEYMAGRKRNEPNPKVELILANGEKFNQVAKSLLVEAKFNNETGNISFRADFPNPDGLLRHGQTGTVLLSKVLNDAVIIPQRATFEILAKRYVYVIDKDHRAHQREIAYRHELEDVFVIKKGVDVNDKIVLEGIRQVRDGENVEYEFLRPDVVVAHMKYHAE